ncbi:type III secretion inner membrane ring lipoprotein SctJ [Paracoccus caeni]|uniref:Lipoprotein n=1 Tax=Paracoccus caeni TaxID=657651 RepID=A0A934SFN0_9RHOB|nr:type III secretion inner membrane ring lipoprotein SctJ [Paracoccus caeni]MBK4214324.1 type III secretion inner membrane ring lipoprotein SctJ [Paracoccus caeni]
MKLTQFIAVLCAVLFLAGCKSELYTGLTEREANEMVAALIGAGIPASKSGSGDNLKVMVDGGRFAEAMTVLETRGLPAQTYSNFGEVFRKEGLVSSPTEERARMVYALSEELSRTITLIDGVLSARIHVVLPETDMLGRNVKPSSASVFVRYSPAANVQDYSAQIKLLVANSIEGLLYDNITVVMVPAEETRNTTEPVRFTDVLGIWVHPASVNRLWAVLGGMTAMTIAAFGFAAWPSLRRSRRSEARTDAGATPEGKS